jgi:hypothetical protein
MKVSGIGLFILVCACMFIPGVSALDVDNSTGYSVTPGGDLHLPRVMAPMISGSIAQGETDWYSAVITAGTVSITTDLYWGYIPNSLTLTVIAPDGTLGPYYDTFDGVTDGRVYLTISRDGGVAPGTWWFKVYGDHVTGTQGYNFNSY